MAKVVRGKALVAKLRAQAGVRDAEALAAYLGRFKKARKSGLSVAQAKKVARGNGSSSSSAPAQSVPKTADEAVERIVKAFIDTGDERVKNDPDLQKKIKANYKRQFKDSIEKVPESRRKDVQKALVENERNALFRDVQKRFGRGAVIVKEAGEGPNSEDAIGAGGEQRGPITLLYSHSSKKLDDWPGSKRSKVTPGGSVVGEGLADTLRHEYGHFVDEKAGNISTDPVFRRLLPDSKTVERDLSFYAGHKYRSGNAQEIVPELFTLITAPNQSSMKVPESMRPAADYLRKRLREGRKRG